MNNHSFILKLAKLNLPGVKIRRVPGIAQITIKGIGSLYAVSYFFDNGKGFTKVRFTSKSKDFSKAYGYDLFNAGLQLEMGVTFKEDLPAAELEKLVTHLFKTIYVKSKKTHAATEAITEGKHDMPENTPTWLKVLMGVGGIIAGIFGLLEIFKHAFTKVRNWQQEREAASSLEQRINDSLFSDQTGNEPAFAIYNKLVTYLKHIVSKQARALIICGPPGMSKTYMVRRTFHFAKLNPGDDYVMLKGSTLGLSHFYSLLYKYRKSIIVLDDFDTPLKDEAMVNLLKAVTDSYPIRVVSLPKEDVIVSGEKGTIERAAPDKFEFKGQIVLITNLKKNEIDTALLSRAPAVEVYFNTRETMDALKTLMQYVAPSISDDIKQEVYDYLVSLYAKDKTIDVNFRAFQSCVEARFCIPEEWKAMVHIIVGYKGK